MALLYLVIEEMGKYTYRNNRENSYQNRCKRLFNNEISKTQISNTFRNKNRYYRILWLVMYSIKNTRNCLIVTINILQRHT